MKKEVYVNIIGKQYFDDDENITEFYTEGTFYKQDDKYYLTYDDNKNIGDSSYFTVLRIGNDKVTMTRTSNEVEKTRLVMEKGKRNIGNYNTNYGDLFVGITTKDINLNVDENGGEVRFEYSLDVNYELISNYDVKISIKEI